MSNMTKTAAAARNQRMSATQRLISQDQNEGTTAEAIAPKPHHRAKRRYMVEPKELQVKVAHA